MSTLPPIVEERTCETTPDDWTIPRFRDEEVHVWRQDLERAVSQLDYFRSLLSEEEERRANRFRFAADGDEFVVSRGTLRNLLAGYQGIPARQLQFSFSEYGRPSLLLGAESQPIQFNISHSSGVTLLAFSPRHRIGIDVEKVRYDFDPLDISENYFSLSERAVLRGLPLELRHPAFFRCWTRKEAFIKALGEGLSHPLDAFDVSLAPGSAAALLATRPDGSEASRWELRDIGVPDGYVAALAIELEPSLA